MAKAKKTAASSKITEFHKKMKSKSLAQAKKLGANPIDLAPPQGINGALSTGLLAVDLITGGGFPKNRMTTVSGDSGAGKTTLIQKTMGKILDSDKPSLCHYLDFEGAADYSWMRKNGTDINKYLDSLLFYFPDFATGDEGLRYINRTQEDAIALNAAELEYHANVFFYDSIPAGVAEAVADNDEVGNQPHIAMMLSKNLPLIKPKLRKANSALIMINQLRENPRAMFGNPEYEPGGNAPTFYADMKLWMKAVSKPKDIDLEKPHKIVPTDTKFFKAGGINIEVNPDGTEDRYKYTHLKTAKNRVFSPLKETYMRIWVEDASGQGRGIDPVFDTIRFYEEIGLCLFQSKSDVLFDGKTYEYHDLKKEILEKPDLRERGFELLKTGKAFEMYFERLSAEAVIMPPDEVEDDEMGEIVED